MSVAIIIAFANQVVECIREYLTNIGSRVADWDVTIYVLGDICFQVALHSAQVRRNYLGSSGLVNDFVGREEGKSVWVVLKSLDDGESAVQIAVIVRGPGSVAVERIAKAGRVDVQEHIDAGLKTNLVSILVRNGSAKLTTSGISSETYSIEDASALVVVEVGAEIVGADSVDAELLHEGSVATAASAIRQGILTILRLVAGFAARLVGHANDLKLFASARVDKGVALNVERRDSSDHMSSRQDGQSGRELFGVSKAVTTLGAS